MCKTIIAQVSPKEAPAARNRRLFLQAMRAGCQVHPLHTPGLFRVDSKNGTTRYLVESYSFADGTRSEQCHCPWGEEQGMIRTINRGSDAIRMIGAPCCHILLVRWHLMPGPDRAAVLELDQEIAQAVCTAPPAPVPPVAVPVALLPATRLYARQERRKEAW